MRNRRVLRRVSGRQLWAALPTHNTCSRNWVDVLAKVELLF
ncbi:hypothetical protein [Saccharopolyspora sp. 5N708]